MITENNSSTIKALFEGTSIPQDKQDQFISIYEAAIKADAKKLSDEIVEVKTTELKEKVEQYTEYVREEYATKLDEYSDYVASKFVEDNKLAVTNGIKAETFDSLVESIKEVFSKYSIILPESEVNTVSKLEEQVKQKEAELAETKKEIISLRGKITSYEKKTALTEAISSLAETQKEKVIALANELVYDETFGTKLSTIVESVKVPVGTIENNAGAPQFIVEQKEKSTGAIKPRKFVNPGI